MRFLKQYIFLLQGLAFSSCCMSGNMGKQANNEYMDYEVNQINVGETLVITPHNRKWLLVGVLGDEAAFCEKKTGRKIIIKSKGFLEGTIIYIVHVNDGTVTIRDNPLIQY